MAPFINWRRTWALALAGNQLFAIPQADFRHQPGQLRISGGDGQIDLQFTIAIQRIQLRGNLHVAQVLLRFVQQPHRAENPAHAPHILIFQPAACAPAHDHHAQAVVARPQIGVRSKAAGSRLSWE